MIEFDISKFYMRHSYLKDNQSIDFFADCCQRYADKGGRHAENYQESRIRSIINRGRVDQGVIYLYYGDDVAAFTGLESYNDKEALMAIRVCVYNPSPVPYSTFFLMPKVIEIAREKGYKYAGASVNEQNRYFVKLMQKGKRTFNGTPFEPFKHLIQESLDNIVVGEKQMYNGVEQQFYFIKV